MKELWTILMEKLKLVDAQEAAIGIAIFGIFTIGMSTVVIVKLLNVIAEITLALSGKPLG
jgi:hypothetical protein